MAYVNSKGMPLVPSSRMSMNFACCRKTLPNGTKPAQYCQEPGGSPKQGPVAGESQSRPPLPPRARRADEVGVGEALQVKAISARVVQVFWLTGISW